MKKGRLIVALLTSMLLTAFPINTFAQTDSISFTSKDVDENVLFREMFGLNSNAVYVNSVMEKYTKSSKFGVALTPTEEKELEKRFERENKLKPLLTETLQTDPDFAWIYIDQTKNGQFNIGFTKPINEKLEKIKELTSLIEDSDLIKIHQAKISEKDLNLEMERVIKEIDYFNSIGITVHKVNTNIPKEKVEIHISPYDNSSVQAIKSRLNSDFIDVVENKYEVNFDSRLNHYDPLQSGTAITKNDPNSTNRCSTGFIARSSSGTYYLVTAGHCTQANDVIYQGGQFIGITAGSNQGGTNDSAVITIPSSLASKLVYVNNPGDLTLTSVQASNGDMVGEIVCKVGIATNNTCGTITSTNVYRSIAGTVFTNVREANYAAASGDSGGLVYYDTMAKGIHFASSGGAPGVPYTTWYSHASEILSYWGLSF